MNAYNLAIALSVMGHLESEEMGWAKKETTHIIQALRDRSNSMDEDDRRLLAAASVALEVLSSTAEDFLDAIIAKSFHEQVSHGAPVTEAQILSEKERVALQRIYAGKLYTASALYREKNDGR